MKRKLIITEQEYLIVCDNKNCDYKVKNLTKDPCQKIDFFLNTPCPNCGENLLTEKDLITYKKVLKVIELINKWFGWLAIFIPKSRYKKVKVHTHNGFKIIDEN